MTHTRFAASSLIILLAIAVAACSQTGDRDEGIAVRLDAEAVHPTEPDKAQPAQAKHDSNDTSVQTFYRDGKRIDLVKGFVNLMPVALQPCHQAAFSLLRSALAHDGQVHGPDASLIDVSAARGHRWFLGELPAAPGRYCGLRLALVPVMSPHAAGQVDMRGSGAFVQVCYYYDYDPALPANDPQNRAHYCVDFKPDSPAQERVLPLHPPLALDSAQRRRNLTLGLSYAQWLDGIDLDGYPAHGTAEEQAAFRHTLASDPARLQRLRENILRALVLH